VEKTSAEQLAAIRTYLKQSNNDEGKSVQQIRREMAEAAEKWPVLVDFKTEKAAVGYLKGEWVDAADTGSVNEDRAILYFHGGGFVSGTCEFYRDLAARISRSSGVKVLTVEYRLAPEHPYPAANEDCLFAYRWLLDNGYAADKIVVGGDSVGGTLALMTLLSLRNTGAELPVGAFLLSPHTDLVHLDGESYESRAALDPTGSLQGNRRLLRDYLGNHTGEPPAILSPLRMDLAGLPDILVQTGDYEVLLSDAMRFADKAGLAGVEVALEVWEQMWSVFQFLACALPEARQAIDNIGQFVRTRLNLNDC